MPVQNNLLQFPNINGDLQSFLGRGLDYQNIYEQMVRDSIEPVLLLGVSGAGKSMSLMGLCHFPDSTPNSWLGLSPGGDIFQSDAVRQVQEQFEDLNARGNGFLETVQHYIASRQDWGQTQLGGYFGSLRATITIDGGASFDRRLALLECRGEDFAGSSGVPSEDRTYQQRYRGLDPLIKGAFQHYQGPLSVGFVLPAASPLRHCDPAGERVALQRIIDEYADLRGSTLMRNDNIALILSFMDLRRVNGFLSEEELNERIYSDNNMSILNAFNRIARRTRSSSLFEHTPFEILTENNSRQIRPYGNGDYFYRSNERLWSWVLGIEPTSEPTRRWWHIVADIPAVFRRWRR